METQENQLTHKESLRDNQGLLVIITGPTASGKDALVNELLERYPLMERVVSVTTRTRRKGEIHGTDYVFLDAGLPTQEERAREFKQIEAAGTFLETTKRGDDYYGTKRESIEPVLRGRTLIWRVDIPRAATIEKLLMEKFPPEIAQKLIDKTLVICIGAPRLTVLKDRFLQRSRSKNEIEKQIEREKFKTRLEKDWQDWQGAKDAFNNVVINQPGDFHKTIEQVIDLIEKHKQENQKKAKKGGEKYA